MFRLITFVSDYGVLHSCNDMEACLDYVKNNLTDDIMNSTQKSSNKAIGDDLPFMLQQLENFFYQDATQNISMAYLMTDINSGRYNCEHWQNNTVLNYISTHQDRFKQLITRKEIYSKFLRIVVSSYRNSFFRFCMNSCL
jgi:hypothetical protein